VKGIEHGYVWGVTETKKLLRQALALSAEDRADFVEALDESLMTAEGDLSADCKAEIARRIEAVERGASRLIPGHEVEARVRASLAAV